MVPNSSQLLAKLVLIRDQPSLLSRDYYFKFKVNLLELYCTKLLNAAFFVSVFGTLVTLGSFPVVCNVKSKYLFFCENHE